MDEMTNTQPAADTKPAADFSSLFARMTAQSAPVRGEKRLTKNDYSPSKVAARRRR
jgi:hypothetical protein